MPASPNRPARIVHPAPPVPSAIPPRMPKHISTTHTDIEGTGGAQPPRMSAKVRQAIEIIATEGKTQREAAKLAGMNESALSRALARPGVQDVLDAKRASFSLEVDQLKATAKKRAILVGMELMEKSTSDNVRAKMVEFFAGEASKGVQINVQNNVGGGAYEYAPRGARVVEINPSDDTATGGQDDESPTE